MPDMTKMSAQPTVSAALRPHAQPEKLALDSYKARFLPIPKSEIGGHELHDILNLVLEDLAAVKGGSVEMRSTPLHRSFLEIRAGSDQDLRNLLHVAFNLTEKHLNPTPKVILFLEPLLFDKNIRVNAQVGQRPVLVRLPDRMSRQVAECPEKSEFEHYDTYNLMRTLTSISRGPKIFSLKVDFGHYILQTFPATKCIWEWDEFKGNITHHRCNGRMNTNMQDMSLLKPILSFARQESQTRGLDPQHFFEAKSEQLLFEATVVHQPTRPDFEATPVLGHISACNQAREPARLTVSNLGLGRLFDWKIEITRENKYADAPRAIYQLLKGARISMNTTEALGATPDIKIDVKDTASALLRQGVTIKTVYKFDHDYERHPYVVDVTIYRRWNDAKSMSLGTPPKVTWGISMYQESWKREGHVAESDWGNRLQFLLAGPDGDEDRKAEDRILNLIKAIHSVREKLTLVGKAPPVG